MPLRSRDANCDMLRLALWMTGALLSFSATALSVRELAKSISVFDIMSFRSGTGLLFLVALAAARPERRLRFLCRRADRYRGALEPARGAARSRARMTLSSPSCRMP